MMAFSSASGIFFRYPDDNVHNPIPIREWDRAFPHFSTQSYHLPQSYYLPLDKVDANATVLSTSTHLTLKQTFRNPSSRFSIPNAKYSFPLYPHASVISFTCHVGEKTIKGIIQPKAKARKIFDAAVSKSETAGLLQEATAEIFITEIGNIPAGATVTVEIGVIGELKQDAEKDTIRFTLPTAIAPKYGQQPESAEIAGKGHGKEMNINVDIDMPEQIAGVTAPNQAISLELGGAGTGGDNSKATVKLAQKASTLDADFVLQIKLKKFAKTLQPFALLEQHPTKPGHYTVMASLVPRINLPPPPASAKPEIIFLVDRSGSMYNKIEQLKSAMEIFLRSLPASGIKFNICSFGSRHSFLFEDGSKTYDSETLDKALKYVSKFDADMGGTELFRALEASLKKRYTDIENTEIFVLTDGEVWNTDSIFNLIKEERAKSKAGKGLRLFSLGIGDHVSYHLVEGMANAGGGFSAFVGENERYEDKVVRMLKTALSARIYDVEVDVEYEGVEGAAAKTVEIREKKEEKPKAASEQPQTLSLFDADAADSDEETQNTPAQEKKRSKDPEQSDRFAHLKQITPPNPIQTPNKISSIYSSQRLLIYLLFRPTEVPRTPKTIFIKAKLSTGANLELKVPVTQMTQYQSAEKSSMLHSLAARSIIKDFEDGTSWLETGVPSITRKSDPGRFDEYVEREAEKLGMEFGIVSKWTSFVAVEKKGEKDKSKAEDKGKTVKVDGDDDDYEVIPSPPAYEAPPQPAQTSKYQGMSNRMLHQAPKPSLPGGSMMSAQRFAAFPSRGGSAPQLFGAAPSAAPTMVSWGAPALVLSSPPPSSALFKRKAAPPTPNNESTQRTVMASAPNTLSRGMADSDEEHDSFGLACFSVAEENPSMDFEGAVSYSPADSDSDSDQGFGLFDGGNTPPSGPQPSARVEPFAMFGASPSSAPSGPSDIISLQKFDGSFTPNARKVDSLFANDGFSARALASLGGMSAANVTALMVAVLRIVFADQEDVWELVVEKAVDWLVENGGSEELVGRAEGLVKAEARK